MALLLTVAATHGALAISAAAAREEAAQLQQALSHQPRHRRRGRGRVLRL